MKKLFFVLFLIFSLVFCANSFATNTKARQFDFLLSGVTDASGDAMAGGTVYFYEVGTSTGKNVATESDWTNTYTSYTLNNAGSAELYGKGNYKVVIKNSGGTTVWTFDVVKTGPPEYIVYSTSSNVTALDYYDLILVDTSSGDRTVSFSSADSYTYPICIKKTASANNLTLDANGAETIDGSTTKVLTSQYDQVCIAPYVSGDTWYIISDSRKTSEYASSDQYPMIDGSSTLDIDAQTEDTDITVGETGSGLDVEWDALDDVPDDADWILVKVKATASGITTGGYAEIEIGFSPYGATSGPGHPLCRCHTHTAIDSGGTEINTTGVSYCYVGLQSKAFEFSWDLTETAAAAASCAIDARLAGWGYNP